MTFDTEHLLLKDYEKALSALSKTASPADWQAAMQPLIQRTMALLKRRVAESETYTLPELIDRFAQEDIEVYADLTIAVVHGNGDNGETLLNTTITTRHYPGNFDENAASYEDNLSLLEVAAKFDIDPSLKIWEVNEDL